MARLIERCPHCGKIAEKAQQIKTADRLYILLKCGHLALKEQLKLETILELESVDKTKKAYEFQEEFLKFAESTNFNCLNADAMGLGKTIQLLLVLKNSPQLYPALIVVPAATIFQWVKEIQTWISTDPLTVYPILKSNSPILPGFKLYVISMDTLPRMNGKLDHIPIKFIGVDECHKFKDPESKRTKALINTVQTKEIGHKIFLSGTPIKNRALEYFVPLNLLSPINFPSTRRFKYYWLVQNEKGQYARIAPWMLDEFERITGEFIIRREKNEVLKNLPEFTKQYELTAIEDEGIKNLYNRERSLLENFLNDKSHKIDSQSLIGWLQKFRHITGQGKIEAALQYTLDFLDSVEYEKIAIGVHHTDVRDAIYYRLQKEGHKVLKLSGEDSPQRKDWILREFEKPEYRVLVINILSGGTGLNLQVCNNALVVERQWSSVDEEQFECRFHRDGQKLPVYVDYLMAYGTIDHFFHEMIEEKRKIFGETVMKNYNPLEDHSFLKGLAQKVADTEL